MKEIRTATVLGANGAMGAASGAILSAFDSIKVHMLARDMEKAKAGIQTAVSSVRSDTLLDRMLPGTYDQDLEKAVHESDWVFECVAENYEIKESFNERISKARKAGTLVSTISSGLSIERLANKFDEDGKKYYYGTHFFNPPYKLTLCELVCHKENDKEYTKSLKEYLEKKLVRHVVITNDTPAFAGNRIGFQLMNEVAQLAEKYQEQGGIYLLDSLLGGYTGRAMSPLATIDLVGLDVHKAIVDNIYEHTKDLAHDTFQMPEYMNRLIEKKCLGMKSKKGLYQKKKLENGTKQLEVYNITREEYEPLPKIEIDLKKLALEAIQNSKYQEAIEIFKNSSGLEAELLRHFIARYISYSFSLVPEVTDINGIDGAMGFGFSWLPPSAWVDLWGGVTEVCRFLEAQKMPIPEALSKASVKPLYRLQDVLDYRSLFKSY